jgi:hypothetical protein
MHWFLYRKLLPDNVHHLGDANMRHAHFSLHTGDNPFSIPCRMCGTAIVDLFLIKLALSQKTEWSYISENALMHPVAQLGRATAAEKASITD